MTRALGIDVGTSGVRAAIVDANNAVVAYAAEPFAQGSARSPLAWVAAVEAAIAANPDVAARIRDGKVNAAGVLVGAVMKATRGQADATRVRELILDRLS